MHVASTYTGTFVVVMLLNQFLFFGFCLNPNCLVAAMPHVLLITAGIGSWINKMGNWGAAKLYEETTTPPTTQDQDASSSKSSLSKNIEDAAHVVNTQSNTAIGKVKVLNVKATARSHYFRERSFVDAHLKISKNKLVLQRELNADPDLAKKVERVSRELDQDGDKESSVEAPVPETRKVAHFILPTDFDGAEIGEDIKEVVARIATEHSDFLKDVKGKLDQDSDLMAIFEIEMEQDGGKAILAHIMAISFSSNKVFSKLEERKRLRKTFAELAETELLPVKSVPVEMNHEFLGGIFTELAKAKLFPVKLRTVGMKSFKELSSLSMAQKWVGQDRIRSQAEAFGIPHLFHFTRCENLQSILRHGLLSVADCQAEDILAVHNDSLRLDAQPDGTSLSISFPNYRMFYKYRELDIAADWAVLKLSPRILWEKECAFYRYNAADSRMRNLPRENVTSSEAFRDMFEATDARRKRWLRAHDPTDPQAEVMVYEGIEAELIETVVFETKVSSERWKHVLGGIETTYAGRGKGLFASRAKGRQH